MTKETTAHTPGPWVSRYGTVYRKHHPTVRLLLADRENPNTVPTERDRNIELAAAAPELLAALEDCLAALKLDAEAIGAAQTSDDIDWFKFGQATALKQEIAMPSILAAIAKAKGEA